MLNFTSAFSVSIRILFLLYSPNIAKNIDLAFTCYLILILWINPSWSWLIICYCTFLKIPRVRLFWGLVTMTIVVVVVLFYSLVLFFSLVFLLFHAFINFRFNARHCILQRTVKTETNLIYTQKKTCLIFCQNFSMEVWSVTFVCEVGWALLLPQARQCTTSFQFTQQSTSTASYLVLVSRGQKVSFKSPVLPSEFRWHCGPAAWRRHFQHVCPPSGVRLPLLTVGMKPG